METADDWRRPGPTAEQQRLDLYTGLAATALALISLTLVRSTGTFPLGPPPSGLEQILWTVAVPLPLIWRRRFPAATALVISAAFIGAQVRAVPEWQLSQWALFAAIYTLGAWGQDRRLSRRLRIGLIGAMFVWLAISHVTSFDTIPADAFAEAVGPVPPILAAIVYSVLINVLFFGFAYAFGETAWISAGRQHELARHAEQLLRSQAQIREHAVVGERVRIARELHDVVAHHVSVMGVQASACRRVLDKDPAKARVALTAIEETARTAVDELRRMLGVLRARDSDADDTGQAAGIDQVETILERAREAGLQATLGVYGEPRPLPGSLSQAVYRVVQEATTNALKHAAGARMLDVRIRYLAHEMEVEVTDDGRPARPANADGLGLIGMRERVAAHGGEFEVGRRSVGGWRVRARFPLPVAAGQPA
ncbi:sensor histidine kinase [Micromonospora endophytica]|uniref:histidine kinase n=1 Tax=Micromonospora endophytica TaxID=515350 RepID=A0A2W2BT42_9ACTN|nr:sensor histidine kinase [Micromonospora endophytica]PZF89372.1 two-component sensor histidine kinase [Micromonospora endophytica]RIW40703.1 sensor histidine kinase [Micromonospora endophytica]